MERSDSQQVPCLRHSRNGAFYLLVGGGIGAALALLFAPKSGAELRTDIMDLAKKGYDETVDFANQIREQSTEFYGAVKEQTEKVHDFAASRLSFMKSAADRLPGDVIDEAAKLAGHEPLQKRTSSRKAANIL